MTRYTRDILLESLASTIADYRQGEIQPITASHVDRWVSQFDADDQLIILQEMAAIMKRFYFSKLRVKECIRDFIKRDVVGTSNPIDVLTHVSFLRIQETGSSQTAMVDIVNSILYEEYGLTLAATATQELQTYIYLDDGIYTGNRLRYDLTDGINTTGWLSSCSLSECTLKIYTIATHKEGLDYVREHISKVATEKQIKLKRYTYLMINNNHIYGSSIEVLWPEEYHDQYVDTYISSLRTLHASRGESNMFRQANSIGDEILFTSPSARRVVERAFLKKGAQIAVNHQRPDTSLRPLGFMKLVSLGFGTFFVTYRNIANNCPLVLWWSIGGWYPLFPRSVNQSRGILVREQSFNYASF